LRGEEVGKRQRERGLGEHWNSLLFCPFNFFPEKTPKEPKNLRNKNQETKNTSLENIHC
jgi:hypothetical protein